MFTCHLVCYPWDLLDEGIDDVLDHLQDQIGATGLSLVAACDEITQFRPHAAAEPKIYTSTGGVFFQPSADKYEATRLKPPAWDQHRKMDTVAKIASHCAARQLDLRLSVSPFRSHRLVAKHADVACKNAYHIASKCSMCLTNADVQEYLLSLVRDLSEYDDASAIVFDEVQWPSATDPIPYVQALATLDRGEVALLNICFCESCLQAADRAGGDGQAAMKQTRSLLDRLCHADSPAVCPGLRPAISVSTNISTAGRISTSSIHQAAGGKLT